MSGPPTHSVPAEIARDRAGGTVRRSSPRRWNALLLKLRWWLGDDALRLSVSAPHDATMEPRTTRLPLDEVASQAPDSVSTPQRSVVGLVLTGGTIGAQADESVLWVGEHPTQAEAGLLTKAWRGTGTPYVIVKDPLRQLSENLEPEQWIRIAIAVRELAEHDGASSVLVLHGTDTMPYTAAALSFLLCDLDVPVVLTGSNVPSSQKGSDAQRNVATAVAAMNSLGPGVYVCFAGGPHLPGYVYLGTHVRKLRASGAAFASINRDPVGIVKDDHMRPLAPYARETTLRNYKSRIDDHVLALRLYPGLDFDSAFQTVLAGDVRGVVVELYASATGPVTTHDRFSLTRFIRHCTERKIPVMTTIPELPAGNGNRYETTLAIEEAGGTFLHDMLPETAIVKMMWALGQSRSATELRDLMLRPIAGELRTH
jgi:L-asparaginase/Glu-tRNA(Gln) amidotransferase subunit D